MPLTAHGSDPANWDGTHIEFRLDEDGHEHLKTCVWTVTAKRGGLLGEIRWFGRWRKYSFFPASDCVFENTCLHELAEFIEARMAERKTGI